MSTPLFGSDEEGQEGLKVNKKFARDYQRRKEKEELRRVQFEDQGGDDSSSTSESEDENATLLTKKLDTKIMRTVNALRKKDSSIYDKNVKFFENEERESASEGKEKGRKPKRYKDVVREQVLDELEGKTKTSTDDNPTSMAMDSRFAYDKEQANLRKAFIESTVDNSDSSDSEGFMKITRRSGGDQDEGDDSTEEVQREFQNEVTELEKTLQNGDNSSLVDPRGEVKNGDRFLLNYFKNRSWIDQDGEGEADSDQDANNVAAGEVNKGYASDESLQGLDNADDFESKYNFRFEEAVNESSTGADFSIIGYARGQTMNTLRRKDETRREKRQQRKERKLAEKKAKEEKLKRLKNAKRNELQEKLTQIKTVLGESEANADLVDEAAIMKLLEGDFDPEKFEAIMSEAYNDEFYEKEDSHWKTDADVRDELKNAEDGDLIVGQDDPDGGLYDNIEESNIDEGDEGEEGDDDDWMEEEEYAEETELEKKVRSRIENELYKLDYEDIVAGIPTRFKYREVEANNFGLSTEEILMARDSNLKQFVSLKKMAPYNENGEYFVGSKRRRKFREIMKSDLKELEPDPKPEPVEDAVANADEEKGSKKKRRRLKKSKKERTETPTEPEDSVTTPIVTDKDNETSESKEERRLRKKGKESSSKEKKKAKKKKKSKESKKSSIEGVSGARLASYGL